MAWAVNNLAVLSIEIRDRRIRVHEVGVGSINPQMVYRLGVAR
jgi:hypothetical protein